MPRSWLTALSIDARERTTTIAARTPLSVTGNERTRSRSVSLVSVAEPDADDEGLVALALEREIAAVRLDARGDLRRTRRELVVQLPLHRGAEDEHQRE